MRITLAVRNLAIAAAFLFAMTSTPAQAGIATVISSTFDSDLEGWEATGVDFTTSGLSLTNVFLQPNPGDMVHSATGGNPGGYARLTDAIEEPSSFAEAPGIFNGNLSQFIGGTLSFDHRVFDRGVDDSGPASLSPYAVVIASGSLFDLNALVWTAPAPLAETGWIHFDINLALASQGGDLQFVEDLQIPVLFPDFPLSGTVGSILGRGATMTFEQILMSVDTVLLPFELANNEGNQNSESAGLDNVLLIALPEPRLALLLAVALPFAALLRRRNH